MKRKLLKVFLFLLAIAVFNACNEPLVNDQGVNELNLKSAIQARKSYIVVLNDAALNTELSNLKGYEKKTGSHENGFG